MKQCTVCKVEKELLLFPKKGAQCKSCRSEIDKVHYLKKSEEKKKAAAARYYSKREQILANRNLNKEIHKQSLAKWRVLNREYELNYKKEYRKNNPDLIKNYNKSYKSTPEYRARRSELENLRKQTDPVFKLEISVRKRLNEVMRQKGFAKCSNFSKYIGCSPEVFYKHFENNLLPGMTMENYGSVWDVDHIIPLSAAKNVEHIYQLSHYKNLQPMFKGLNYSKNSKITKCWQKFQKDKNIDADLIAGFPFDLSVDQFELSVEQLTVEHRHFIKKYEWLGKIGYGVRWVFTARWNTHLAGVVMLSEPNSYQFGEQEALIQRGAVSSWAAKNLNSKLVMFACRWMVKNTNKRYFVAYSDPDAGEIGTIYQACNFDYLGNSFGSKEMFKLSDGQLVTSRHFTRTSSMKKWAKELGIVWQSDWCKENGYQISAKVPKELKDYANAKVRECPKVKQTGKGKYVLLLNYGKQKLHKTWTPKPYPKREVF